MSYIVILMSFETIYSINYAYSQYLDFTLTYSIVFAFNESQ
jgi:hypothetical protein